MYSKSERLLIFRFLFSKKTDGYISIFSWFSIVGITLGVAAIIVVMSVMNGFRQELTKRLIGINSHINIYSHNNTISLEEINIIKDNLSTNDYLYILQLIETNGLIIKNERSKGVLIRGYDYKDQDHYLSNAIIKGDFFDNKKNNIIVGDALASSLKVKVGDKIKLAIPKSDKTILGNIPRFKTLIIKGIFDFGMYEYDANLVFIDADLARKLILLPNKNYNQTEIYLQNPTQVEKIKSIILNTISSNNINLFPVTWKERNSSLINALKVEKNVMFLILTLIIFVASMNIISGLIIFVKEKNKDIGILKTFGLSDFSILKIFFTIGVLIGLIGATAGVFFGVVATLNIEKIQIYLESIFKTKLFAEEIYFLSSLPSEINFYEVFIVFLTSIIISILSTIFPAIRSANVDPIKTIRNE
tara:strand:- start:6260 stop:7510 length:1251 start_codon:yes stop_codon:yes gene_type:complete